MPRYTEKKGKVYDAGVEISQATIDDIKKRYPEKIKHNIETAKSFPPSKNISDFANKDMSDQLKEIGVAEAASAARSGKNVGELGKKWNDTFKK